jgi:hypothetical protein
VINFLDQIGTTVEEYRKVRDKFVKHLYLKRQKIEIEGKNDPYFTLSWGDRATLEYDKKKMLQTVSKIMNKAPKNFTNQYNDTFGETSIDDSQMLID